MMSVLASFAILHALGHSVSDAVRKVGAFEGVDGRMESVERGQNYKVVVDYAHTPDALRNALGMLKECTEGNLHLVFGCGGDRDKGKRLEMTRVACAGADRIWATADNPRTEPQGNIFKDMRKGLAKGAKVSFVEDRRRAISLALDAAREKDTVLIAGKGHEAFQEVQYTAIPFDDRKVAGELLSQDACLIMPVFDLDSLAEWSGGTWKNKPGDLISGFSIDSRSISAGEMFVAIEAERDGHDFLSAAEENGAGAALVKKADLRVPIPQLVVDDTLSAFHRIAKGHRSAFRGSVVGITGSCGKTSTKDTLGLLMGKSRTLSTEGNLNNHLGVPLTVLRMNDATHKFAVVEAGINGVGEMNMLARTISPDLVIVTLIGHSHLEGLGSVESVAREKAMLFEGSESDPLVLFPEDCLSYELFSKKARREKITLSLRKGSPPGNPATKLFTPFGLKQTRTEARGC